MSECYLCDAGIPKTPGRVFLDLKKVDGVDQKPGTMIALSRKVYDQIVELRAAAEEIKGVLSVGDLISPRPKATMRGFFKLSDRLRVEELLYEDKPFQGKVLVGYRCLNLDMNEAETRIYIHADFGQRWRYHID